MSLATYASPIDLGTPPVKLPKNKTIKNKKVAELINKIHHTNDDEEDEVVEFIPPENPVSSGVEKTEDKEETLFPPQPLANEDSNMYQNQEITWDIHQQPTKENSNKELNEKLNYLIYLLEDDRELKTHNVTEEVILYAFLGIFIIFVLDTFNKGGKYSI